VRRERAGCDDRSSSAGSAGVLDLVAELEPEPVGEEPSRDRDVGGADDGVPELAWLDPVGTQQPRSAQTLALVAAGAVVGRRGHRVLHQPRCDLQRRPGAGRRLRRADAVVPPAVNLDAEPGQAGGGAVEVIAVIDTDAQLDEATGRGVHDLELPPAVAGGEPTLGIRLQPELGVVVSRLGHVRHTHGDRRQTVQSHRQASFDAKKR